jgi:glucose/arabinose dehydrogenase/mono/diheme cytochrome c family protein
MTKQFTYAVLLGLGIAGLIQCRGPVKLPPGDPGNGGLILPGGFDALVVVDSIGRARHLAVNDNGDIYVKLEYNDKMKGKGGTVGLRDTNGDGKADSIVYFGDYTDVGGSAVGVTIHDGYLYTSTVTSVLRTKLTSGDLIPESKTEVIVSDTRQMVKHTWHNTKPVAFDNDDHIYVPFGAPTNAGQDLSLYGPTGIPEGYGLDPEPGLSEYAGIWRFDASKTGQTQKDGYKFAGGLRSVVGMTWNPKDNSLYLVMNGIDNFHTLFPNRYTSWQAAVLPAESLIKVTEGADYGWPYAYFDQMLGKNMLEPGYGGDGKTIGRAAKFDVPIMGFPGHWAPMDLLFYQGDQFPERYKKGVFIAFHGSTDRSPYPQAGYIVCFAPFENGKPTGQYEVFADGFTGVDTVANTSDAKYRPMGLSEGPDGSLYISESNKGKIWRVMFKGDKTKFGKAQLEELENRKLTRSYIKTPDSVKDNLNQGSQMEGSILFNIYCATCHQRNGMGDNNRYPPLAGSELVNGDKDRLIGIVLNGLQGEVEVAGKTYNGLMPAHGGFLDDGAVASITSYIRKNRRFKNESSPVSPLEVTKVRNSGKKKSKTNEKL